MTRKQKRILIASAIKYTIISLLVIGLLTMYSALGLLENSLIPIQVGIVRLVKGFVMTFLAIFCGIKLYT